MWRARLSDLDTGNILFETENKGGLIRSSKRWFVRFSIDVWSIDEGQAEPRLALSNQCDGAGRDVLIQFPLGTLGDSIAWFSYAARFGERHPGCRVTRAMSALIIPLLHDAYPEIRFVAPEDVTRQMIGAANAFVYAAPIQMLAYDAAVDQGHGAARCAIFC